MNIILSCQHSALTLNSVHFLVCNLHICEPDFVIFKSIYPIRCTSDVHINHNETFIENYQS